MEAAPGGGRLCDLHSHNTVEGLSGKTLFDRLSWARFNGESPVRAACLSHSRGCQILKTLIGEREALKWKERKHV